MKKILILALALTLGGCAAELQKLKTVYEVVTTASVSPDKILVAANAYDLIAGGATQYLVYCKANITTAICSADNRRTVIRAGRAGHKARDQLEPYIVAGGAGPGAIYNALIAAVNTLNASPAATFGVVK